ncbi:MAG: hypothetical protein ACR2IA_04230 [Pyrinomonadaceae bacterium]
MPKSIREVENILELSSRLNDAFSRVALESEMARRETLIAPILLEVARNAEAKVKIEFPLDISRQLKGSLDYLLHTESDFLVVEAKNEDLYRGFKQLAVELIALKEWINDDELNYLYGAVSTGNAWQFGKLDVKNKRIIQDLNIYTVPRQLEELLKILIGILERKH